MVVEKALKEIGLSDGETKVYLALLKLGTVNVAKLKEESGLHRTTIYDFLEKLMNKGLTSHVIKAGVKYFTAAKPSKLHDIIKEKEEHLQRVLPELEKLSSFEKKDIQVEVYRGSEGFKTVLNDILNVKKDFFGFGIEEAKFQERFPYLMKPFFNKEKKLGIKEYLLAKKGTKFVYGAPNVHYKYIEPEYFSPVPMGVYGDKIWIGIWNPLTMIIIENKELADSWKKYFDYFWKKGEKNYS